MDPGYNCIIIIIINDNNNDNNNDILMYDIPNADHNPDPLENAMNAINAFRDIPGNFLNEKKERTTKGM